MASEIDDDAVRAVYAVPPDEFLATRTKVAAQAKAAGDPDAAREIAKLRKPTVAAWIVNALVHTDDTVPGRVAELGDELRSAQHALDAKLLRELSARRRALVAELTASALDAAGRADASAAVQDEIRSTFDAAVADPDVAARLGRLQRAESFSGFGFGDPGGPPQLTLVRGGRSDDAAKKKKAAAAKAEPKTSKKAATKAATKTAGREDAARSRALGVAREAADAADAAVGAARAAEKQAGEQVRQAEQDLARAKDVLAAAKGERDGSRDAHRAALATRRDARRALDRAEKGR